MQEEEIRQMLNYVGKEVFVEFYYDFKDTDVPYGEIASKIAKENPRSFSQNQNFRRRGRTIFERGQQLEALDIIIDSDKLPIAIVEKAKQIKQLEMGQYLCNIDDQKANRIDYSDDKYISAVHGIQKSPKKKQYKTAPKIVYFDAKTTQLATVIQRDPTVAKQALFNAEYRCELYPNHETFIKRKDDTPYTEPHHLIPMFMQGKVKTPDGKIVNLDVENNIVSLCSNCHNKLHYGKDIKEDLQKLYEERKELLGVCGITVSFDELSAMYSMIE
ncbi:MAG: HNH endonuclease [Christensenellaceae bacterium]